MPPYKHLFFDLDNTLYDFDKSSSLVLSSLYEEHSLADYWNSLDHFIAKFKKHNSRLWGRLQRREINKNFLLLDRFWTPLKKANPNAEIAQAEALSASYIQKMQEQGILMPHAEETLSYLHDKGYTLHIISNGFQQIQHNKLTACKLLHFFTSIYTSDQLGYIKPHREFFHRALSGSNALRHESLVIGDSYQADILGAKRANIDSAIITPHEQLDRIGPPCWKYHAENLYDLQFFL